MIIYRIFEATYLLRYFVEFFHRDGKGHQISADHLDGE